MKNELFTRLSRLSIVAYCLLQASSVFAQEEPIKFGDFEQWITRHIKESAIIGGETKTLYEVGPKGSFDGARAYKNMGGSPWATSNVYAKVHGVEKTNISVFPDKHNGGTCAKLTSDLINVKALGILNLTVLAPGSLFLGEMLEPVTSTKDPLQKMDLGIPFTKRPKSLKLDYKFFSPTNGKRIRENGFSRREELSGQDMGECTCLLQKRWETPDGKIHALRVGTMKVRFNKNTPDWVEGKEFPINYGDITAASYYHSWMGLNAGAKAFYARNSKGKIVKVEEEGWSAADEQPTHLILKFNSSHGNAYEGTPGTTLWIDNVMFVY